MSWLKKGIHVALEGHFVMGCGGSGEITSGSSAVMFDGKRVATIGSFVHIPSDPHGCPSCPHDVMGSIITGLPNVTANGQPVAILGSAVRTTGCCGPRTATVGQGYKKRPQLGANKDELRPFGVGTPHDGTWLPDH